MRIILLLPCLLLGGCAERWERPGSTPAQAATQLQICTEQAQSEFPPRLQRRLVSEARTEQVRECRTQNGRENCSTNPREVPARYEEVDLNAGARPAARRDCMYGYGFVPSAR